MPHRRIVPSRPRPATPYPPHSAEAFMGQPKSGKVRSSTLACRSASLRCTEGILVESGYEGIYIWLEPEKVFCIGKGREPDQ